MGKTFCQKKRLLLELTFIKNDKFWSSFSNPESGEVSSVVLGPL